MGHLSFPLISRRYEQSCVLISSNRPVEEWDEVFGDQLVAAAILDRLLHHSHLVTIRGDSCRLRGMLSGDIENWTRGDTKTGPPRRQQRTTD